MIKQLRAATLIFLLAGVPIAGPIAGCQGGVLASRTDQRVSQEKTIALAMEAETAVLRGVAAATSAGALDPDTAEAIGQKLDTIHALLKTAMVDARSGGDGQPELDEATRQLDEVRSVLKTEGGGV